MMLWLHCTATAMRSSWMLPRYVFRACGMPLLRKKAKCPHSSLAVSVPGKDRHLHAFSRWLW